MKRRLIALAALLCLLAGLLTGCAPALDELEEFVLEAAELVEDTPAPTAEAPEADDFSPAEAPEEPDQAPAETDAPDPDGSYTTKEDVALYLRVYGVLPQNFITKAEARELGWSGGGLEEYAPGKCIGGDRFGNYEGLLPEEAGREYHECDIDTLGASSRGARRIVFSNDGLIFYTDDHYESFTQLWPEP